MAGVDSSGISNVATITVTVNFVVPVAPAVWLHGSGLLKTTGIARRKKAA
jgi:hypothetical protein